MPNALDMKQFEDQALHLLNQQSHTSAAERDMHYLTKEQQQEMRPLSWIHAEYSINALSSTRINAKQEAERIQKWLEEGAKRSVCGLKAHVPNTLELTATF